MRLAAAAVLALTLTARAEDYQCGDDAGCTARIVEDGVIQDVEFRKGDMVSTDAGWWIVTDDGWVKVNTGSRTGGPGRRQKLGLTIGEVMLWTPAETVWNGTYAVKPPTERGTFLRPVVSLAAQPPSVSLIGL